jgi:hypothetical protein
VQEVADHVEDRAVQDDEPGLQRLVAKGLHQVALCVSVENGALSKERMGSGT